MNKSNWIISLLAGIVIGGAGVWFAMPAVRGVIENHLVDAPTQEAKTKVASALPGYVSLGDLTLDGSNGSPFPFKGSVSPQEDLYAASIKRPDLGDMANVLMTTPPPAPLTILTVVNKQGVALSFYGKVFAEKEVDKWIVGNVNIDSGLQQLGRPKGGFPPGAVISGTPEGDKALADFDAAVTDYKQRAAAVLDQQKQAAQKVQQEKEAQLAAYRSSLLNAFKVGTSYKGTLTALENGSIQEIDITFTSVTGFLVKADVSNPSDPERKQSFSGTISMDINTDPNFYALTMGPGKIVDHGLGYVPPEKTFWYTAGQLSLRLASGGVEGTGLFAGRQYKVILQKVSESASVTN